MLGRLRSLFARRTTEPQRAGQQVTLSAWLERTDAGVYVDADHALQVATVFACSTLTARTVGMLPWNVFAAKEDTSAGNERLDDHPVAWLLHRAPNAETTAKAWREAMVLSILLEGNAFAEIERDTTGRPYALWPIRAGRVALHRDQATGALRYKVTGTQGGDVWLSADDMLHFKGPSLDGVTGLSVVEYAKQSIGLSVVQERFASRFIANQASPSGIVTVKGSITPDGMKRMRAELDQVVKGPRNAGRFLISDGAVDFKSIGVTPQDAEFLAQRRFSVEEIARWFGVPPQKIGDTSKQTFANYEQANIAFLTDTLLPLITGLEQEVNRKLFRRAMTGRGQPFSKINVAAIARADMEKRTRAYALGRQWGWFSVNDIRRMEDLEPIGPEGDEYLRPLNMTPLGSDADVDPSDRATAELVRLGARRS